MKIDPKVIARWEAAKDYRDITKIAEKLEVSTVTISNAFTYKKASPRIFLGICEYFKQKSAEIKRASNLDFNN